MGYPCPYRQYNTTDPRNSCDLSLDTLAMLPLNEILKSIRARLDESRAANTWASVQACKFCSPVVLAAPGDLPVRPPHTPSPCCLLQVRQRLPDDEGKAGRPEESRPAGRAATGGKGRWRMPGLVGGLQ
uniref:Uncharacterized protein n=1 Tax=Sphaerodactylus townsendi TaxID=933632 RepID=A0ACB8FBX4_9SAUR